MKRHLFPLFFLIFLLGFFLFYHYKNSIFTFFHFKQTSNLLIVLDAGHGGKDPGKVGVNDVLEKDINLSIAKKLKYYLEKNNASVIMTRDRDSNLSAPGISSTKTADLQARKNIVLEKKPSVFISIHQNSFPQESSRGAQVFYSSSSKSSKKLAETIQKQLLSIDSQNHRQCKSNADYFLLRNNPHPSVIIECGFLSNREEADLLNTEEYQKQLAWNICVAILEYCSNF